jgi:hypothetical protein
MANAYERAMGLGDVEIGDPAVSGEATDNVVRYRDTSNAYTSGWRIDFGFGFTAAGVPTVIANGATATFKIEPRTPFKPEEMIIPSYLCPGLYITNIEHADRKYIDGSPVPADLYSEVSTRKDLRLPTVMPSDVCIISILNLSGAAVNFAAALRGMKVSR